MTASCSLFAQDELLNFTYQFNSTTNILKVQYDIHLVDKYHALPDPFYFCKDTVMQADILGKGTHLIYTFDKAKAGVDYSVLSNVNNDTTVYGSNGFKLVKTKIPTIFSNNQYAVSYHCVYDLPLNNTSFWIGNVIYLTHIWTGAGGSFPLIEKIVFQ